MKIHVHVYTNCTFDCECFLFLNLYDEVYNDIFIFLTLNLLNTINGMIQFLFLALSVIILGISRWERWSAKGIEPVKTAYTGDKD